MSSEKSSNPLEQFVLLSKSAKGAGAVELIKQALEATNVYVFGELLEMPHIQELATGPHQNYFALLNLFAYGTFKEYKEKKADLPELTPAMLNKLRHLTMVSLATKTKCIPYRVLLQELDIPNLRTLEDLIIEVIYADIIRGKLDQKNQQLEVDYAIGRDIQADAVPEIISVLQDWCLGCEAVLQGIETQITKANANKDNTVRQRQRIEQEITNIKKTLKSTHAEEESMVTESVSVTAEKPTKKTAKTKGLRGSSGTKLWK
ncbi:COP9 signalosome complex subunit 7b-like isoform X1 [Dreissena polymorpha]|uniref:COP9 signalosome complex subunit 7b-like isoform X1 n=1 Tax=Dreissena polymorpha TaxID=45954 RepID=UPI0022644F47|nr:COP9 signalosome complex subunit 7b-like isoform X1 [Dreissena polymorpha]XP_052211892.1 COP9 signalosome complex subunit 7b-like isoform X1 [Dreissena polymorpha]XP_052211893.1 COP9 signalosome complex subunit 7b-like isoform X1 [Dreissena polymorpha]XP_052211894.1 COP9 signalosome complex subunit 7b-like isoform X1 [Dreissena polymorpha]XP_052211895.1 COP9 signalosome complex subunit 7b-like isoform X1 [Dreissena polymorpha]XP_052211896.1 COP9 signalosome complex subunit 7b-like isoform X